MAEPSKFQWIRFETAPLDEITGKFYLDDVVMLRADGCFDLYQIKHTQNPDLDKWDWERLLEIPNKKNAQSLIQKWFQSYFAIDAQRRNAALLTNGFPAENIEAVLVDQKIDLHRVRNIQPEIWEQIRTQLGETQRTTEFFAEFTFQLGQKDVPDLATDTFQFLYTSLRATTAGVKSLLLRIQEEAAKRVTRPLSIDDLRSWTEFDDPRPLDQAFGLPSDFQFFDKNTHDSLFADLHAPEGGVKILCGKPGTGKSTYLAKLNVLLNDSSVLSLLHHYFIPDDQSPMDRLEPQRVIEGLKALFKKHPESLGPLANMDSRQISLREFIHQAAADFHKQGKAFVLIIDGLDHVLRYADERDLKEFLREIAYPQPGVWIVIGTQESATALLPQILLDRCPKDQWIQIQGLNEDGTARLIRKNVIRLTLPKDQQQINGITGEIFKVTQGNPLHLRYTLNQLKRRLKKQIVTVYECERFVPYGGEIEKYYGVLWNQISSSAKTLGYIIASVDFSFTYPQLRELISQFESNPKAVSEAFAGIDHLLNQKRQRLTIYHNSFLLFLKSQKEYEDQEIAIKKHLEIWLQQPSHEDLQWAELRKVQCALGNIQPILDLDREWMIDAIVHPRDPAQIVPQLNLGAQAAFQHEQYGRSLKLGTLSVYYENALQYTDALPDRIWEEAFRRRSENLLSIEPSRLSTRQLSTYAECADARGILRIIFNEIIDVLNSRHKDMRVMKTTEIGASIPEVASVLVGIVARNRSHDVKRTVRYIRQYDSSGWTPALCESYVRALLATRQTTKISELLNQKLPAEDVRSICTECSVHDFWYGVDTYASLIHQQDPSSLPPLSLLQCLLSGYSLQAVPALPPYSAFPEKVPEYDSPGRVARATRFYNCFVLGVIGGFLNDTASIEDWISKAPPHWAVQIVVHLLQAGVHWGQDARAKRPLDLKGLLETISRVPPLVWPDDRDSLESQSSFRLTLQDLVLLNSALNRILKCPSLLTTDDIKALNANVYFAPDDLLQIASNARDVILDEEAFTAFSQSEISKWKTNIETFPKRSEHYVDLAKLAQIHGNTALSETCLRLAANNFLGYGYHKDLYLDYVLDSVLACHSAGSARSESWLRKLAPVIENVREYTDGDETRHLPEKLAAVLGKSDLSRLLRYYYYHAAKEDLFLAEEIFADVVGSINYRGLPEIALASTAIDDDSLATLKKTAQSEPGPAKALKQIEGYFGRVNYRQQEEHNSPIPERREPDYNLIRPEQLKSHLATIDARWDRRSFLVGWTKYWLKQLGESEQSAVFALIQGQIQEEGIHEIEAEALDVIYPLALQRDNAVAFEYLYWAQANDSGWQAYWSARKRAQDRWRRVKEDYATRYMEFFSKSIFYSGARFGKGHSYFVPIPRGIEFLVLFGDLKHAEEITDAAVELACELMADLQLPASTWWDAQERDCLDLLLQRLVWPSNLVRERAASALSELLGDREIGRSVFSRVLSWLKDQQLESAVVYGLLPLLKTTSVTKELPPTYLADISNIISAGSTPVDTLLDSLAATTGAIQPVKPPRRSVVLGPNGNISAFFNKYVRSFLPPIYETNAREIGENVGRNFYKDWALTAEQIRIELGVQERVGDLEYFMGGEHAGRPALWGVSTALSEIYRSAFVRVLDHYRHIDLISGDEFLEQSYATIPIDLSYWPIQPKRAPAWWPKSAEPKAENSEIAQVGFSRSVDDVIARQSEFTVLGLHGAVEPASGWAAAPSNTSVMLVAFGYRVIGSEMPEPPAVGKELLAIDVYMVQPTLSKLPLYTLHPDNHRFSTRMKPTRIGDVVFYPLVARFHSVSTNLWQWFRGHHVDFALAKDLASGSALETTEDAVNYVADDRLVATASDWLDGFSERVPVDAAPSHGSLIELRTELLDTYLSKKQLRLGYILRTTHLHSRYSSEKPRSITDYQLINVSPIII